MFSTDYEAKINELNEFKQKNENVNKKFVHTQFEDLCISDIIYIEFYPYSQKHIDNLYPLFGKIKEIKKTIPSFDKDNKNDIYFDNLTIEKLVLTHNDKIFDGFHYWTSYYGNTRGYEYSVYKLIITNKNIKSDYYISSDDEISDSLDDEISDSSNESDQLNQLNQLNKSDQLNQLNKSDQLNQLNQLNESDQLNELSNQLNESNNESFNEIMDKKRKFNFI